MGNYGLGISNVTNLDKDREAMLSQQGAFTVVSPEEQGNMIEVFGNENLHITGFIFIGVNRKWKYRLLMWLALKFAGEGKKERKGGWQMTTKGETMTAKQQLEANEQVHFVRYTDEEVQEAKIHLMTYDNYGTTYCGEGFTNDAAVFEIINTSELKQLCEECCKQHPMVLQLNYGMAIVKE